MAGELGRRYPAKPEGARSRGGPWKPRVGVAEVRRPALPPLWIGFRPAGDTCLAHPPRSNTHEAHHGAASKCGPRGTEHREVPPAMDLLLDVELPVSVSFGKTEIAMKDVLKLTTGQHCGINRGVNEPVEVLVNHCLIARGEVVVVEGNYGVRIHRSSAGRTGCGASDEHDPPYTQYSQWSGAQRDRNQPVSGVSRPRHAARDQELTAAGNRG